LDQLKAINCVIIDDDPFIQDLLNDKINHYFPEINILGFANSGKEGVKKIQDLKPNLVFLDVEMTDMTGFEMLTLIEKIDFKTIFITSYKHYAIKAIRFNALDYLLKPFDLEELKNAIRRFKSGHSNDNISLALKNFQTKNTSNQILKLKTHKGDLELKLQEIITIKGERNYSNIYLTNNRKKLISKTLSDIEDLLDDKGFFRCHKSHIVNSEHIIFENNNYIKLIDNITIPISRRKKEDFKNWRKAIINK